MEGIAIFGAGLAFVLGNIHIELIVLSLGILDWAEHLIYTPENSLSLDCVSEPTERGRHKHAGKYFVHCANAQVLICRTRHIHRKL